MPAVAEVVGASADTDVPVPRVTMPLGVTLPGVAAVCANAGKVSAIEISTVQRAAPVIGATQQYRGRPVNRRAASYTRRRNCSGLESAENQRGDRDPDGPPKPK